MMYCTLKDGTSIPVLGQGTWYLGEHIHTYEAERNALRTGIESGMTLLDTAEMYGDGKAERLIGGILPHYKRQNLFLVSKVYPHNADRRHIFHSCDESLRRLGTDYLDLYLLHWRGSVPLQETVECMEELNQQGKIRRWGVSNFDKKDMEELFSIPGGSHCMVNQVLYHMASRGIEYDLLPWMREHQVTLMAYCPLAQGGRLSRNLLTHPMLEELAAEHQATVPQILLSFVIRDGHTVAIPRTGNATHTWQNSLASELRLSKKDLERIESVFPAPTQKTPLDIE